MNPVGENSQVQSTRTHTLTMGIDANGMPYFPRQQTLEQCNSQLARLPEVALLPVAPSGDMATNLPPAPPRTFVKITSSVTINPKNGVTPLHPQQQPKQLILTAPNRGALLVNGSGNQTKPLVDITGKSLLASKLNGNGKATLIVTQAAPSAFGGAQAGSKSPAPAKVISVASIHANHATSGSTTSPRQRSVQLTQALNKSPVAPTLITRVKLPNNVPIKSISVPASVANLLKTYGERKASPPRQLVSPLPRSTESNGHTMQATIQNHHTELGEVFQEQAATGTRLATNDDYDDSPNVPSVMTPPEMEETALLAHTVSPPKITPEDTPQVITSVQETPQEVIPAEEIPQEVTHPEESLLEVTMSEGTPSEHSEVEPSEVVPSEVVTSEEVAPFEVAQSGVLPSEVAPSEVVPSVIIPTESTPTKPASPEMTFEEVESPEVAQSVKSSEATSPAMPPSEVTPTKETPLEFTLPEHTQPETTSPALEAEKAADISADFIVILEDDADSGDTVISGKDTIISNNNNIEKSSGTKENNNNIQPSDCPHEPITPPDAKRQKVSVAEPATRIALQRSPRTAVRSYSSGQRQKIGRNDSERRASESHSLNNKRASISIESLKKSLPLISVVPEAAAPVDDTPPEEIDEHNESLFGLESLGSPTMAEATKDEEAIEPAANASNSSNDSADGKDDSDDEDEGDLMIVEPEEGEQEPDEGEQEPDEEEQERAENELPIISLLNDSGDAEDLPSEAEPKTAAPEESAHETTDNAVESLLCNESITASPPLRNNYSELRKSLGIEDREPPKPAASLQLNSKRDKYANINYSTVLNMVSNFSMLQWQDRVGNSDSDSLRFQLNEFNLLQLHEKGPLRQRYRPIYEKPIYERDAAVSAQAGDRGDQAMYLCRRCNCHGPADDFLAPEFCSLECLKRDGRKRSLEATTAKTKRRTIDRHRPPQSLTKELPPRGAPKEQPVKAAVTAPGPASRPDMVAFSWERYMQANPGKSTAAVHLFLNPFPTGPNNFEVGMKLEAIDPENASLFCVCSVVDVQGYRLKLSFDGYTDLHDFWVNADSMNIFPPGWCAKTNRVLQPPKGVAPDKFNWVRYLVRKSGVAAPRSLFTHLNSTATTRNPFRVGMHLEAEDLNDTGKLCVATVADVLDDRIRVHFDGWDDSYDYWVDTTSPYIHPCGWYKDLQQLIVPPGWESVFQWDDYIRAQKQPGAAAHPDYFAHRSPILFKQNSCLEVVDPRLPQFIRPAVVVGRKGHRLKLHLIGWPQSHCFWLEDDSPDLHPIGWCATTGHPLETPPGYQPRSRPAPCGINGCPGLGNVKNPLMMIHNQPKECPYTAENWNRRLEKPIRVPNNAVVKNSALRTPLAMTFKVAGGGHLNLTPNAAAATRKHDHVDDGLLARLPPSDHHMAELKKKHLMQQQMRHQQQQHQQHQPDPAQHSRPAATPKIEVVCLDDSPPPAGPKLLDHLIIKKQPQTNDYHVVTKKEDSCEESRHIQVAKEFLCDYGPRLRQTYNIWLRNFPFDAGEIVTNPITWSAVETGIFIKSITKSPQLVGLFREADIDGAALLMLEQNDLTELLGINLGPAVKIYSAIVQLRTLTVGKFGVRSA